MFFYRLEPIVSCDHLYLLCREITPSKVQSITKPC